MINKVTLIGNLGRDPESKTFEGGKEIAKFSVATSESFKGSDGEWQERTEWHNVIAWNELAERAVRSLHKGTTVYLEGKLTHRSYEDKDGAKRYITEVVANYFRVIRKSDGASDEGGSQRNTGRQQQPQQQQQQRRQQPQQQQPEHYAGTNTGPIGSGDSAADDDLPF